jgi:hypothetical protein
MRRLFYVGMPILTNDASAMCLDPYPFLLEADSKDPVVPVWKTLDFRGPGGGGGSIEGVPKNCFGATPCFLLITDIKKQNV